MTRLSAPDTIASILTPERTLGNGGCADAVVKEIIAAKETILVQAYSFTSAPIAKARGDAHKRGVKVQVIVVSHGDRGASFDLVAGNLPA